MTSGFHRTGVSATDSTFKVNDQGLRLECFRRPAAPASDVDTQFTGSGAGPAPANGRCPEGPAFRNLEFDVADGSASNGGPVGVSNNVLVVGVLLVSIVGCFVDAIDDERVAIGCVEILNIFGDDYLLCVGDLGQAPEAIEALLLRLIGCVIFEFDKDNMAVHFKTPSLFVLLAVGAGETWRIGDYKRRDRNFGC